MFRTFSQPFPHVVPIPLQQEFCVCDLSSSSLSKVYSVICHRNKTSFCTLISLVFIIIKLYNQSFKNNRQKWVWEQIALTLVSTQLKICGPRSPWEDLYYLSIWNAVDTCGLIEGTASVNLVTCQVEVSFKSFCHTDSLSSPDCMHIELWE